MMNYFKYTELNDKSAYLQEQKVDKEKLKGRFKLKI